MGLLPVEPSVKATVMLVIVTFRIFSNLSRDSLTTASSVFLFRVGIDSVATPGGY